jgi:hypothetical protein
MKHIIIDTINNDSMHPIVKAAKVYQDLITLHLFTDGNGRTARLSMHALLMQSGFPPPMCGKMPMVANFVKYIDFNRARVFQADTFVPLNFVVRVIQEGVRKTIALMHERGLAYKPPNMPIASQDEIDALTFRPVEGEAGTPQGI